MSTRFSLQVPIDDRFRTLGPEIAAKFVEVLGGAAADGEALADAVAAAMTQVSAGHGPHADVHLAFESNAGGLQVTLQCAGHSTVVRHALAAAKR
jgi:hypothetical protein